MRKAETKLEARNFVTLRDNFLPHQTFNHSIGNPVWHLITIVTISKIGGELINQRLLRMGEIDEGIIHQMEEPPPMRVQQRLPIRSLALIRFGRNGSPIDPRCMAKRVVELPIRKKAAQQKEPWMADGAAAHQQGRQQKTKIEPERHRTQRHVPYLCQQFCLAEAALNRSRARRGKGKGGAIHFALDQRGHDRFVF